MGLALLLCISNGTSNGEKCFVNGKWMGRESKGKWGCLKLEMSNYITQMIANIITHATFGVAMKKEG